MDKIKEAIVAADKKINEYKAEVKQGWQGHDLDLLNVQKLAWEEIRQYLISLQSSAPLNSAGVWVKASEGLPDKCVYGKIKSFLNPDEIVNSFINPVENGYYDFRGYTFSYTMTKDYIIEWLDESQSSAPLKVKDEDEDEDEDID